MGTTPNFYVEQARQTVLGNGKEIMLFHYGSLPETNKYSGYEGTPIKTSCAFKKGLTFLFDLARMIKDKPLKGIYLPKLPNSDNVKENYIFSILGMLGLPSCSGS
ncbi:MAG: hypothetical protein IPN68_14195 [Bacteroidetes bacterium]|nr:hypothetical protein [Bacteroidota bacterium]